jgi:pimeloyl-ACP methyl ester carboxylesterase
MVTFVLVHGAWNGGYYWKKVAPRLRAAGHDVYTPTMTGLGERSHLFSESIDLTTHVRDIVNVIEFEGLTDVALVGHSYSGMVVTGVADRIARRLSHLIYVDAFLPVDGESMWDCTLGAVDDVFRTLPETATEFGLLEPGDIAWLAPRLGLQPRRTFRQRLRVHHELPADLHCAFVHTSEGFNDSAERARRRGFTIRTYLEANHNPMITRPIRLTEILLELVDDRPDRPAEMTLHDVPGRDETPET